MTLAAADPGCHGKMKDFYSLPGNAAKCNQEVVKGSVTYLKHYGWTVNLTLIDQCYETAGCDLTKREAFPESFGDHLAKRTSEHKRDVIPELDEVAVEKRVQKEKVIDIPGKSIFIADVSSRQLRILIGSRRHGSMRRCLSKRILLRV